MYVTPEKLKMMKNSNFNPPNMNKVNPNVNYNQIPYKIPNFGNMDFKRESRNTKDIDPSEIMMKSI